MSLTRRSPLLTICAIAIMMTVAGCGGDEDTTEEKPADADATAAIETQEPVIINASLENAMTFQIKGMTCMGCVNSVTGEINKLASVEKCQVILEPGSAVVVADESAEAEIIAAVTDAGFTIERTDDADS